MKVYPSATDPTGWAPFGRLVAGSREGGPAPFAVQTLLQIAERQAGCELLLDPLTAGGLDALVRDLSEQVPQLSFMGKKLLQSAVVEALVKRARLNRYVRHHPEILRRTLAEPVFIIAPFRTGTTFLHRLLAADPRLRWVPTWESSLAPPLHPALRGAPGYLESDERIGAVREYLRKTARLSPELPLLHPTGTGLPEECFGLLEPSFLSPSFLFWSPLERYLAWLGQRTQSDWDHAYGIYAHYLQLLDWWRPGGRWLLKSPIHLWGLRALLRRFPDARVVQIHRPAPAPAHSFCALVAAHHALYRREVDRADVRRIAFTFLEQGLERAVHARGEAGSTRFLDIRYDDLVGDPLGTVGALYPRLGLSLDPATAACFSDWIEAQRAQRLPVSARSHIECEWLPGGLAAVFQAYDALARYPARSLPVTAVATP